MSISISFPRRRARLGVAGAALVLGIALPGRADGQEKPGAEPNTASQPDAVPERRASESEEISNPDSLPGDADAALRDRVSSEDEASGQSASESSQAGTAEEGDQDPGRQAKEERDGAPPEPSSRAPDGRRAPKQPPTQKPHRFTFSYGGGKPVGWPAHYRRFGIADGVLTAVGATAAVASGIIGPNPSGPTGGVWIDDAVRNALRPDAYQSRLLAADLSDVLIGFSITYGLMLDPLVNAGWLRKSKDVGRQLFAMNLEVLSVTLGIQQIFANGVGRQRPYGQVCGTDELDARTFDCTGDDRFRSHFSGHSAVSFSMAAATCTHHTFLPLSGKPPVGICALGFSNAIATALLRIVADKHYVTDIMVGSAVGTLIGWGLPFLHYKTGVRSGLSLGQGVEVMLLPYPGGASLMGVMP